MNLFYSCLIQGTEVLYVGTAIVLAVLVIAVAFVIYRMVKAKKEGKGGCSCGCGSCPNSGICHGGHDKKDE